MGLLGGSSSSESSQSSAATQTQLGDPIALNFGKAKKTEVNITDGGSVRAALNFAGDSLRVNDRQLVRSSDLAKRGLSFSQKLGDRGLDFVDGIAEGGLDFTADVAGDGFDLASNSIDFAGDILAASLQQGSIVADTVVSLADSFQGFVNRENNPGERVNLYLILGAASVAALFLWKS